MGRFTNNETGVTVSVADEKDYRFGEGWTRAGGGEPPRKGRGSGRGAWVDHAEALGIEVAEGMTREEIMAAVDALNADG